MMAESSASKSEKPKKKGRCSVMPFFMTGTVLLLYYSSGLEVLWRSYDYLTAPVKNVSAPQQSTLPYFVAYPHHYNYILDEPNRCRQESPFLVLIIPVAPDNVEARDIIRKTWGKEATVQGQVVHRYFLLGRSTVRDGAELLEKQVSYESQKYHDILQSDFVDSYYNLTIKSMVMFEWLSTHCPQSSYAMKVDSDVFVNVNKLIDMLLKAPRHHYLTGNIARGSAVFRDRDSKWFLPVSVLPDSTYPPYPIGLGYVFSLDLPKKIVEASAHIKAIYIEDVYLGLCMRHLGIEPTDPPRGGLFRYDMTFLESRCYWNSVIATLLRNSKQILDVWESQTKSRC